MLAGLLLLSGCGNSAPRHAAIEHRGVPGALATPAVTTGSSGATNVELPATFTVRPGGTLTPATVSAPGSVPVLLTVISGDGRSHQVVVKLTPGSRTLRVPAGGRASARFTRLAKGSYPVAVDGVVRGHLMVGVAPGP